MRRLALFLPLFILAACGGKAPVEPAVRDSAGITIVEYPAEAWDNAPTWSLAAAPMASIGGAKDSTIDLTQSGLATMVDGGRVVVSSVQPPQLLVYDSAGTEVSRLGRAGEGPGEYRFITGLAVLGTDTLLAYDIVSRKGLLFGLDGEWRGAVEFPLSGMAVPFQLSGRTASGIYVFNLQSPFTQAPEGADDVFRVDMPVVTWTAGSTVYDTAFMIKGPESFESSIDIGGAAPIDIARPIAFGATPFVAVGTDLIWSTTGEAFTFQGRDPTGALKRIVRVARAPRPVTEGDRGRYKTILKQVWENARNMGAPPAMIESELAKIDKTNFSPTYPAIGQLMVARDGNVWVTTGVPMIDSVMVWAVFDREGKFLAKVTLPEGLLFSATTDRVVLRHEDEDDVVSIEVWKLSNTCTECD